MGKLSITGTAEREVSYDTVELRITFNGRAKKTADAVAIIMEECEQLLKIIIDAGVSMKDIHIGENSVDRRYGDNGVTVSANREITLRLKFDMPFINSLMDTIRDQDFSVDMDCSYRYSNNQNLHDVLLREAVEDSKKKAEFIAEIMGQKVIGIESVNHDSFYDEPFLYEMKACVAMSCDYSLSDQLESPLTRESESIDVVWLIE